MFSELAVKGAKPSEKSYMIRDDHLGNKKEHQLSLGTYPHISLKEASLKRDEMQLARSKGESPS